MPDATFSTDPLDHPDLDAISRSLREQLDDVLAAEQYAARIASLRRTTMRDRLIQAEDMSRGAVVTTQTTRFSGRIAAVGTDHLVLEGDRLQIVALRHVAGIVFTD